MEFVRRLLSRLDAGRKIRVSEIDLLGEAEGVRVGLNDVHELLGVSAAHAGNNRHTILMSGLQNNPVAGLTSLPAYSQLAELVRGEDVNPRLVEHETGLYFIHEFLQCIFQCAQIEFIVRAIGQWDVEIRLLFLRRVIVRTVHAECKDSFLIPALLIPMPYCSPTILIISAGLLNSLFRRRRSGGRVFRLTNG